MMDLFLSAQEIADLTDKRKADAQIRWLKARNFPFEISGAGKPKVLRAVVIARMGGSLHNSRAEPQLRLANNK